MKINTLLISSMIFGGMPAYAFDWSGGSDLYVEELSGFTTSSFDRTHRDPAPYQESNFGWGYRFGSTPLYLNAFLSGQSGSTFVGGGYGFGLGLKGSVGRIEAGMIRDIWTIAPDYEVAGGYLHFGINLFRWSHFLIAADAQLEGLRAPQDSPYNEFIPRNHYVASAGLSLHATDINTVIPAAGAITIMVLAACAKHCRAGFDFPRIYGSGEHEEEKCDDKDNKDCRQ